MEILKDEQILQIYKETIIRMFAVSEKRASILAQDLFDTIISIGGVNGPDQAVIDETVEYIIGKWIKLNVAADADNE